MLPSEISRPIVEVHSDLTIEDRIVPHGSVLDITPLIISLSEIQIPTKETIFHTAYYIESIPCSISDNPFDILSTQIEHCLNEDVFLDEILYLIRVFASKFPDTVRQDDINMLMRIIDHSTMAFDWVIDIFLVYCSTYHQTQYNMIFNDGIVAEVVDIVLSRAPEINIAKCFDFLQYFITLFPSTISYFIKSIIETPYCRISACFSFLIKSIGKTDFIDRELMDSLVRQCDFIKVVDIAKYISLMSDILSSDTEFIEFISDNKLITKLIHFARPNSMLTRGFPHEDLINFCSSVFSLFSIDEFNKEIDDIIIDYFISLLYIDQGFFAVNVSRVIGILLVLFYDNYCNCRCRIRIPVESLVDVVRVLIGSSDEIIKLYSVLIIHHSLFLITDPSEYTEYIQQSIFNIELLEYIYNEITEDSIAYTAGLSVYIQIEEFNTKKCEKAPHEQLDKENSLEGESDNSYIQISSDSSYSTSDSYELDIYSYEEEYSENS